jgi:Fe-S cluster assembly ATP-binding protein
MLEVKDLEAKIVETGQQILNGVSLRVCQGEVHAIMGKNGSGKSTLSKVLVGHPDYEVTGGTAYYKGKNLFDLEPEERSHEGLFLSFQSPIEIPGVSNVDFLRMACNARRKALGQTELDPLEFYAHVIPKVRSECCCRALVKYCCQTSTTICLEPPAAFGS